MKYETGICYNCGADQGLHQFETMQCPRHGIEETRFNKLEGKFYPQQWESTTFEDSGLRKLSDAAPESLQENINNLVFLKIIQRKLIEIKANVILISECNARIKMTEKVIKKAT